MKNTKCWVTYGRTESGDDLQCLVFLHEPTEEEVDKIYKEMWPDEYEEIGCVYWKLEETETIE